VTLRRKREPAPALPAPSLPAEGESGLLAAQTDPVMRGVLRALSAGLRARYGPRPAYVAPATRALTVLHVPEAGADTASGDCLTVCGLVMAAADLWQPVERRDGDRVCPACAGAQESAEALW